VAVLDVGAFALAVELEVAEVLLACLAERDVRRRDIHERIIAREDRLESRLGHPAGEIAGGRTRALRPDLPEPALWLCAVRQFQFRVEDRAAPALDHPYVTGGSRACH
jgi:hypothetical protein